MSVISQIVPVDTEVVTTPRGFLRGTRVMTVGGLRAVEEVRVGDRIASPCGAVRAVRQVVQRFVLRGGERLVAVSGEARGLHGRTPDLLLPAGQMIVVAGDRLAAYFGVEEALAPIGALANGTDLRLVEVEGPDAWYEIEVDVPCLAVVEGLQVALGAADDEGCPLLSESDARLLALAA